MKPNGFGPSYFGSNLRVLFVVAMDLGVAAGILWSASTFESNFVFDPITSASKPCAFSITSWAPMVSPFDITHNQIR